MKQKIKIALGLVGVLLLFILCNLDFPYDPLDPSTKPHIFSVSQMAVSVFIALGFVALFPLGLFVVVLITKLSKGEWRIWRWLPEFCRNLWRIIRDE
jgi:hypothetical protein